MLKARVVTALLLLAGFLVVLFLLPFYSWLLFVAVVAGIGAWEWGGLVGLGVAGRRIFALSVAMLCAILGAIAFDLDSGRVRQSMLLGLLFLLSAAFWLLAVPCWLKAKWRTSRSSGIWAGAMVLIPACLALMQLRAFAPVFLLAVMAAVWVADIAAYVSGRAFGRRKLAPDISPGKTWEGVAGAVAGVLVYGAAAAWIAGLLPGDVCAWAVYAAGLVILTAVSIIGDLFESLAKRQAGVKDSGTILPGHGGVLDRIDSLTSTLPLVSLAVLAWEMQQS